MKTSDNSKRPPKQTVLLFVVLISVGIMVMLITLYFSMTLGLNAAQKTLNRNVDDLKKQCNEYIDFLTADEAKSLVRLTEQAEDIGETLRFLSDDVKKTYLDEFCDSQRLDFILVLDENMMPDNRFISGRTDYREWKEILSGTAITSVLSYPKKIYSARTSHDGEIYDIAAAARHDTKGIVFCAMLQNGEKLVTHYSPVRNLLATNETALDGTLYIAEGDDIVASNRENAPASLSDIPELTELIAKKKGDTLTKFSCNDTLYYGGSARYRSYSIYAFYRASEVFADSRITLLFAFFLYVLIAVVVIAFYFRNRVYHNQEISRQNEIIHSISHIYLLTSIVDMKGPRYTILKYPEKWGKIKTSGVADKAFFNKFLSYVGEEFRDGYLAFINPETIQERLGASEYVEYDYQDVSGKWLNDKIIPQERDENGNYHSYILARKDIHEQKKLELEYQEKLKTALRSEALANQSKTDFLRRMSHDIRTPINVILGMLEISDSNPNDSELLQSCRNKSKTAAEYLLELVNDILTINKADAGGAEEPENTASFDLADEVNRLYLVASERAKPYGVTLEPPTLSIERKPLEGNSLYLRQIMMNVISNAAQYSRKGGSVHFSVSQAPHPDTEGFAEVSFVCEDHGIGMSKEFQKRMFEPFAQEGVGGFGKFGSVGLGLSIVKKFVDILGGTICVDSEQNVGTRFEIVLPYKYANKPIENKTEADKDISLEGLTVLLVEDNELNMEIAEYMATNAGAKVFKAYNGKEAVNVFAGSDVGSIDVVLTDITMPDMDGLEETRQIRALDRPDARTVPIIAMTANLFEQDIKACKDAGMTGFLAKPLNIGQLLSTILQQVKGRKA